MFKAHLPTRVQKYKISWYNHTLNELSNVKSRKVESLWTLRALFLLERCFRSAVLTAVNKAPARSNDF